MTRTAKSLVSLSRRTHGFVLLSRGNSCSKIELFKDQSLRKRFNCEDTIITITTVYNRKFSNASSKLDASQESIIMTYH